MDNPSDELEPILRFDYFVVRLTRSVSPQARVFGLVERLGSGEKRWFDTGEQLLRFVTLWPGHGSDLLPASADPTAVSHTPREEPMP